MFMFRATEGEFYNLLEAGASRVISDEKESSLRLSGDLLRELLGVSDSDLTSLTTELADYMEDELEKEYRKRQKKRDRYTEATANIDEMYDELARGQISIKDFAQVLRVRSISPMFEKARRNLEGIFDSVRAMGDETVGLKMIPADKSRPVKSRTATKSAGKKSTSRQEDGEDPSGLLAGATRPAAAATVTSTKISTEAGIELEQELGVTICTLPRREKDSSDGGDTGSDSGGGSGDSGGSDGSDGDSGSGNDEAKSNAPVMPSTLNAGPSEPFSATPPPVTLHVATMTQLEPESKLSPAPIPALRSLPQDVQDASPRSVATEKREIIIASEKEDTQEQEQENGEDKEKGKQSVKEERVTAQGSEKKASQGDALQYYSRFRSERLEEADAPDNLPRQDDF